MCVLHQKILEIECARAKTQHKCLFCYVLQCHSCGLKVVLRKTLELHFKTKPLFLVYLMCMFKTLLQKIVIDAFNQDMLCFVCPVWWFSLKIVDCQTNELISSFPRIMSFPPESQSIAHDCLCVHKHWVTKSPRNAFCFQQSNLSSGGKGIDLVCAWISVYHLAFL